MNNYEITFETIENIKADSVIKQREANKEKEIVRIIEQLNNQNNDYQNENKKLHKNLHILHTKLELFENKYGAAVRCDCNISYFWCNCHKCDGKEYQLPEDKKEPIFIAIDEWLKDWDKTCIVKFKRKENWDIEILDVKTK